MKKEKILIFSLIFSSFLFLTSLKPALSLTRNFWEAGLNENIVYNPFQGLGICHHFSASLLSDPLVSFAYESDPEAVGWSAIEPSENQFNWQPIDNLINLAKAKGKKIWLQVYNDGHIPLWAQNKVLAGKKMVLMGTPNNWADPCNTMNPRLPLPWDEVYLSLWQRVVQKLAERYDNNETVEAIIMMAGGGYGEMTVCSTCGPAKCWAKFAGCSSTDENCVNRKFNQAVINLANLYLNAFIKKPVVLQLGSGVYGHTTSVYQPVLSELIPKYGLRILLKYNGWNCALSSCVDTHGNPATTGCDGGAQGEVENYITSLVNRTRFGLEPALTVDTSAKFKNMAECSALNIASYACLQDSYYGVAGFQATRQNLAKRLGARVALKEIAYEETITVGQARNFRLTLKNLGKIPPFFPKKEGIKDLAASYLISFELFKNEEVVFKETVEPSPGSNTWRENTDYTVDKQIIIPNFVPSGNYELRIGLYDPEAAGRSRQEYFRFLNKTILDSLGRAKIGQLTVVNPALSPRPTAPVSPTPTVTVTQGPTAGVLPTATPGLTLRPGTNYIQRALPLGVLNQLVGKLISFKRDSFWVNFSDQVEQLLNIDNFYVKER